MAANKLKCVCSAPLKLVVSYSGCDWESVAGEGAGYAYPVQLECTDDSCARTYTLGYLNSECGFSPPAQHAPYDRAEGYIIREKG